MLPLSNRAGQTGAPRVAGAASSAPLFAARFAASLALAGAFFFGASNFAYAAVLDDPGDLTEYSADACAVYSFTVTGTDDGRVWGTDVYTDDSDLSTAAVHAGVLALGETGVVQVQIAQGVSDYVGSTRNGVTTSDYGDWPQSYSFVGAGSGDSTCAPPDTGSEVPEVTTNTPAQVSIGTQTNATVTAINTNIAGRFGGTGFGAGDSNIFVSTSGLDAGSGALDRPELNAWIAFDGRRFTGESTGNSRNLTFGLDHLVTPDLVIGGFIGMNLQDLTTAGTTADTRAPLFGAYAAHKINNGLFVSGFAGYGRPEYTVSGTDYTSTRKMVSLSLNGSFPWRSLQLKPDVTLLATQEDIPASAVSTADTLTDVQTKVALRAEPQQRLQNGLLPYLSLAADYRRKSSDLQSLEAIAEPRLGFGADWQLSAGSLRFDVDYGTVASGTNDLGIGVTYDFRF